MLVFDFFALGEYSEQGKKLTKVMRFVMDAQEIALLPSDIQDGIKELEELFNHNVVLDALGKLEIAIKNSQLANRFSETRKVAEDGGASLIRPISPLLHGKSEAYAKRLELLREAKAIQASFGSLFNRAQELYVNFEASKREFKVTP